jgi:hypothetical protein
VITASRIELVKRCVGSHALPHRDAHEHEVADGKDRHATQEESINAGDVPAEYTERWPGMTWRAEVKFAYDIVTGDGRELGVGNDRDYSTAHPTEVCGTADVVGLSDRLIVIVDRKGFDPSVSRAAQNAQVHLAALAFSRAHGIDDAHVAIHHEVRPLDVAELDMLDLDAFAVEVRDIFHAAAAAREAYAQGAPLELNEGKWCRWCPAFDACPKKRALVQMVASNAADDQVEMLLPLNSDEGAAMAYDFAQRLRMLLKRVDAAIYARAAERPIPLPNGMMLGKVQTLGNERLDGDIVYEVIKARHGQAIADAAVERTATKKRIREALGFVSGKGQLAAMERSVLDDVRARGGAKREPKETIEEYPAKQLKAAP